MNLNWSLKNITKNIYNCVKNKQFKLGKVEIDYDNKIILFPTKNNWYDNSSTYSIKLGLIDLHTKCILNKINKIYIPKIGSGLGGLDFNIDVLPIIFDVFNKDVCIEVIIVI